MLYSTLHYNIARLRNVTYCVVFYLFHSIDHCMDDISSSHTHQKQQKQQKQQKHQNKIITINLIYIYHFFQYKPMLQYQCCNTNVAWFTAVLLANGGYFYFKLYKQIDCIISLEIVVAKV